MNQQYIMQQSIPNMQNVPQKIQEVKEVKQENFHMNMPNLPPQQNHYTAQIQNMNRSQMQVASMNFQNKSAVNLNLNDVQKVENKPQMQSNLPTLNSIMTNLNQQTPERVRQPIYFDPNKNMPNTFLPQGYKAYSVMPNMQYMQRRDQILPSLSLIPNSLAQNLPYSHGQPAARIIQGAPSSFPNSHAQYFAHMNRQSPPINMNMMGQRMPSLPNSQHLQAHSQQQQQQQQRHNQMINHHKQYQQQYHK